MKLRQEAKDWHGYDWTASTHHKTCSLTERVRLTTKKQQYTQEIM